jgi:P4 family phage/plasmid primase-like protien
MSALKSFLAKYISTGQKDADGRAIYTHTALLPAASYNIPLEARSELHRLIAETVCGRKAVHLTEKNAEVTMIKVDIDLKYPMDCSTRQHTTEHVKELLRIYDEIIRETVALPDGYHIDAYVFERKGPYPDNGNIKDGIHIMYPDICLHTDIQKFIRLEVLKKLDRFLNNAEIGRLPIKNTHEDVVDLAVISRNNWLLYGCSKPGKYPYVLGHIFRSVEENNKIDFVDLPLQRCHFTTESVDYMTSLINKCSMANCPPERIFSVNDKVSSIFQAFRDSSVKKRPMAYVTRAPAVKKFKHYAEEEDILCQIEEAKHITKLLADWRSDSYVHWIEVGLCLHNINRSLLDCWKEFSQRSDKYEDGCCEAQWYGFEQRDSGLNIGSLHRWARLDNEKLYQKVRGGLLESLIMKSVSGSTQDVASVIYKMYRHQYVCLDGKGRKWAEFVNHCWKICDNDMSLKKRIGKDVLNQYLLLMARYNTLATEYEGDRRQEYLHKSHSLSDITYRLRDITFKDKLMKECVLLFHDPVFESTLNSNPNLIGLENGVYDLVEGRFRDGQPQDCISVTTGNDFPSFDINDVDLEEEVSSIQECQEILDFMKQVIPKAGPRRYMWKFLGSCLEAFNKDEKFHIWTGVGGNGKSKLIELIEEAMGEDLSTKIPITFLTKERAQSNQASPEIAAGRYARFASMQEPDESKALNSSLMKEMTGNDKVPFRDMYEKMSKMKPQYSIVLMCNKKPKITVDDEGTWRRLVVIDFIAKFVEGEPKGPYQYRRNPDLSALFPVWGPYFFALLTIWHKIYKVEGLTMPAEIEEASKSYREECDSYAKFFSDYIVKDPEGSLRLDESYMIFKEWFQAEYSEKPPSRCVFKERLTRHVNHAKYNQGSRPGWKGWSLKHPDIESDTSAVAPLAPLRAV